MPIDISFGLKYNTLILVICGLFIFFGIYQIVNCFTLIMVLPEVLFEYQLGLAIGLVIIPPFTTPFFIKHGVLFDIKNTQIKVYASFYGFKSGKWKPLEKTPFLSINKLVIKETQYFNVLITDNKKEQQIILKKLDTFEEAEKLMKSIMKKTELKELQNN